MTSRIDSGFSAEVIIAQLQQECKEWESKFRAEKEEVYRLSGASSKQGREIEKSRTEFAQQKTILDDLLICIDQATAKESAYKEKIIELEAIIDSKEDAIDKAELVCLRSQLHDIQQKLSMSEKVHNGLSCEEHVRQVEGKLIEAETEVTSLHDLTAANKLIQEENTNIEAQLSDVKREAREDVDKAEELQKVIDTYQADTGKAQARIKELEVELSSLKSDVINLQNSPKQPHISSGSSAPGEARIADNPVLSMSKQYTTPTEKRFLAPSSISLAQLDKTVEPPQLQTLESSGRPYLTLSGSPFVSAEPTEWKAPQSDMSVAQLLAVEPQVHLGMSNVHSVFTEPFQAEGDVKPNVNLNINLNRADQSKWNLLQRAQSAISKTSKVDVTGPPDVVQEFVAGMDRVVTEYAEQSAAATHWERVALRSLAEVNSMRSELNHRSSCNTIAHRNLLELFEAQEVQLKEQVAVSNHLQQKMNKVRAFLDEANAEMRLKEAKKLTDIAATQFKLKPSSS